MLCAAAVQTTDRRLSRYATGEVPKRSLKTRLKCETSSKPLSNAISVTFIFELRNSADAYSSRFCSSHLPGDSLKCA